MLEERVRQSGLMLRGAFHPTASDGVPNLPDGRAAVTLVLVGNVGPAMWDVFAAAPEASLPHSPLDAWSRRIIGAIAASVGAYPLFPFGGPPHLPFIPWAKRAEPVAESPLGMLIHPDHGLWHAYRGALAFAERVSLPPPDTRPRPCDACAERPCLKACPVGAFDGRSYDVVRCVGHLSHPAGVDCMTAGCLARRACPVGRASAYVPAQAAFHMQAFLRNRQG
ncbi:MAG: 4Fe-4S dicluster domain-containing protein [Proteobacteria bacterium]|nr:4Fe-4S dicluster domain-containing protein [Pseudomonadota bacterium]MBI3499287.1 4Fe-4S dicluster domain-containing protein [Pseudomonadota bacterium]